MDVLGPMPYVASNMMLDAAFQRGARNYWKSHFLHELSDDAIGALIEQFDRVPTADESDCRSSTFTARRTGFPSRTRRTRCGHRLQRAARRRNGSIRLMTNAASRGAVAPMRRCSRSSARGRYMNYLAEDDMASLRI